MKPSITRRLAAMFALAALATFSLTGAVLYRVLDRELTAHQDDELRANLQNTAYSIAHVADTERWARVKERMDSLNPANGRVRFWVLSDDPRFQYGKGLDAFERFSQDADGGGRISLPGQQQSFRTLSQHIAPLGDRPAVRLIAGIDTAPFAHTLDSFLGALAVVGWGAIVLVMGLGLWITRVGLRPLVRLSAEAQALRPRMLSQRLQATDLPVELSDLAQAFNGALGRLEDAYQQLEAFNADVAHELRTPLANLIGGTQVALSRERSAPEFQEALQSNLEELERLRSIVNDMLFLARADQGEAATGLVDTRVADEVAKTVEFFEFVLDESGGAVDIEGDREAQAPLDTALFRRALSNLLQNAIQHAPPGSRLAVAITPQDGALWIGVRNSGAPIAPEHLPRLFDRFYRVDPARHDRGGHHGHGLGLAIVKAVARMHGGSVKADSQGGVTTIAFSVAAR
ncbi:heavy metal sensor histidine kinase [Pseudorhodoferax sp.]|uniref:heavy metal sensor histidine kinase n=1 Tax=Pseudorhodoferax sp. TaxID=1993553 RepID=UPI002DD62459|nr:heavy metal sensor histidine kinase [Pseudorhodoferax sp.]